MIGQRHAGMPLTLGSGLVGLRAGAAAARWPQPSLQTALPLARIGWRVGLWPQRRARPAAAMPVAQRTALRLRFDLTGPALDASVAPPSRLATENPGAVPA